MNIFYRTTEQYKVKNKDKLYLSIITILAVFTRVFFILKVPCNPTSDFDKYQKIATNIFMNRGHSYLGKPVAFQPMGYPYTLGLFYKLIGFNNIFYGKILNVILSSITLIIILLILFKLCKTKFSIYLSYILICFSPNYIAYNNVLGSEILVTFLFTIILYLQLCDFKFKNILIGIFVGLATLTKPFFLVYPVILAVIQWLYNKKLKETLKLFLTSFMIMCIIVAPWTYRNYKKFNSFIPVSYNGGYVKFINNNDNANGAWMSILDIDVPNEVKKEISDSGFNYNYKGSSSKEMDIVMVNPKLNNIFKREAKKWTLNNPIKFFELGFKRLRFTFFYGSQDIYDWGMNSKNETILSNFLKFKPMHYLFDAYVYILSFFGFIYMLSNFKNIIVAFFMKSKRNTIKYVTSIPVINTMFFALICFVFEGQQRYNFPLLFLFSMCTAIYIEKMKRKSNMQSFQIEG